jgi:hypothetical protein
VQNIYDPDPDHQREKNCCGDKFGRTTHFEVSRAAPRKRYVLQSCRCCLLGRHVETKAAVLNYDPQILSAHFCTDSTSASLQWTIGIARVNRFACHTITPSWKEDERNAP